MFYNEIRRLYRERLKRKLDEAERRAKREKTRKRSIWDGAPSSWTEQKVEYRGSTEESLFKLLGDFVPRSKTTKRYKAKTGDGYVEVTRGPNGITVNAVNSGTVTIRGNKVYINGKLLREE